MVRHGGNHDHDPGGESVSRHEISTAVEAIVLRKLTLLTVFAGVLVTPFVAVHAQDQPQSLGDVARQNRKDKEKNTTPAKTVLTDDNFGSGSKSGSGAASGTSAAAAGLSNLSAPSAPSKAASGDDSPMGKAWEGIGNAEGSLDKLAPLDRASLGHVILEGNDVDFPGRRAWEDKAFVAKEHYVARSRRLLDEMKEVMTNAQTMRSGNGGEAVGTDNPGAKNLLARAQGLMSEAQNVEAEFKSVMQEGIDQAKAARH